MRTRQLSRSKRNRQQMTYYDCLDHVGALWRLVPSRGTPEPLTLNFVFLLSFLAGLLGRLGKKGFDWAAGLIERAKEIEDGV